MYDQTRLHFAVTRFTAFVSNLPLAPDEDDILEYHEIVRLLEEASRQDLSQFRVAPGRVQQEANRTAVGSYSGSWQTRDQKKNLVEYAYFRGQVRGLIAA